MLSSRFHRGCVAAAITAFLISGQSAVGQEKDSDEETIRQRGQDYVAAVRRGDGDEIAAFWTAEGTYVDESGTAVNGRTLAHEAKGPRQEAEGRAATVTIDAIHFITSDVAVEDGRLLTSPGIISGSTARRYTAIWVRQKGKWLLDGVREATVRKATHHDRLEALAWMVGDWIADDDNHTVHLSCRWSDDKHFLLREIDVRLAGREPLHVTQRIGWDARERQVKSWTFDSEGGYGDALWFHKDGRWIIEAQSVLHDGSRATGTNLLAQDGDDAFSWESTNGEIEGERTPDMKLRMIRTTSHP